MKKYLKRNENKRRKIVEGKWSDSLVEEI